MNEYGVSAAVLNRVQRYEGLAVEKIVKGELFSLYQSYKQPSQKKVAVWDKILRLQNSFRDRGIVSSPYIITAGLQYFTAAFAYQLNGIALSKSSWVIQIFTPSDGWAFDVSLSDDCVLNMCTMEEYNKWSKRW